MTEQPNQNKRGGARRDTTGKKQDPAAKRKREKRIMIVMIVLAVIMVLAATVAVLYTRWVQKPTLPPDNGPSANVPVSGEPVESGGEDLGFDPVEPKVSGERKSEDFYTILVFGADETSGLTDTMMVVSYDITNQRATVMSIPRDTLANTRVSGVDAKKMNAVYKFNGRDEKGIEALKNEVSELVGFMPDYYVMIDWELVGQMVDAIGGVYFDVPYHMGYDDPYQDLHIHFEKGYQYLNGEDAMNLVRWRKNNDGTSTEGGGGDTSRLNVQHQFLKAVLSQTLQLKNVTRIGQLAELFGKNVVSDLTIENLFWFGSQAIFGGLNVDDVEFITMPYAFGEYPTKDGSGWKMRSFVYPVRNQLLEIINEGLNPFVDEVSLRELDLIYVNSSGGLSATSGKLADSSMASLPAAYLEWKDAQENPSASLPPEDENGTEPGVSDPPAASQDPIASLDPSASQPLPVDPEPTSSAEPIVTDDPDSNPIETMPEWLWPDAGAAETAWP